jgi:hypothetical protein
VRKPAAQSIITTTKPFLRFSWIVLRNVDDAPIYKA